MNFWFTTSHGDTVHNQPNTTNYVSGEPPEYPEVKINYRYKCLKEGFARFGYPNVGDLRNGFNGRLAPEGYDYHNVDVIGSKKTKGQLEKFASIQAGDLILIPSEMAYQFHLGVVLTKEREKIHSDALNRPYAYHYFHDISNGDFYECSHRVNVEWAREEDGRFASLEMEGTKGLRRMAFCRVVQAANKMKETAIRFGLVNSDN